MGKNWLENGKGFKFSWVLEVQFTASTQSAPGDRVLQHTHHSYFEDLNNGTGFKEWDNNQCAVKATNE